MLWKSNWSTRKKGEPLGLLQAHLHWAKDKVLKAFADQGVSRLKISQNARRFWPTLGSGREWKEELTGEPINAFFWELHAWFSAWSEPNGFPFLLEYDTYIR